LANWKKWLVFDPAFLVLMVLLALFNFFFDQAFKGAVLVNPELSFLYVFQFILIIPAIDTAILLATHLLLRAFRRGKQKGNL